VFIDGEVGEEGFDFGAAHFVGVALVVEQDEASDPIHVSVFGADGVVFEAQGVADTSTSSVQAWSSSFLGLGSIWVPLVLTNSGSCPIIMSGE